MIISNRLKAIAKFVDDNANVLDLACDHGLLSIYLADKVKTIIASDIAKAPLESAAKNLKKYKVSKKINLVLAPGLKAINEEVDTVIIAGLGAKTIIEIIEEDLDKLNKVKKLILSPHSEVQLLREFMFKNNFSLIEEEVIYDKNKYYFVLVFIKAAKNYSAEDIEFGPILKSRRDKVYLDYLKQDLKNKKQVLDKNPNPDINNINEIKRLENFINS